MSDNNKKQPGGSHLLRILAGGYLVYLSWSLAGELFAGTSSDTWLGGPAAVLFGVVGAVLIITSGRALYRQRKDETKENSH